MGGCINIEQLIENSQNRPLLKEIVYFNKLGYSGGDFQHIFLNTYTQVAMSRVLRGNPILNK